MPRMSCAVVGCTNGSNQLDKWHKERCSIHENCHKGRGTCVCKAPFELLSFPKVDEIRLEWENCVNRVESVNRTVKYNAHVFTYKKGDKWRSNPTDRICSKHFVDEKPTVKNPLPTLFMSPSIDVLSPPRKRKPPPIRKPLTSTPKSIKKAKDNSVIENEIQPEIQEITLDENNNQDDIKNEEKHSIIDHSYSFSHSCACGNDCCLKKQQTINELVAKVAELEN